MTIAGSGGFQIEHYVPLAQAPDMGNLYTNAFYICRLCNTARGSVPELSPTGDHLLNPSEVAWSEHFRFVGDELLPLPGDRDAAYTAEVYDFNDRRKVEMRRQRRLRISQFLKFVRDSRRFQKDLLKGAEELGDRRYLELAHSLRSYALHAHQNLKRYSAIPADADTHCLCGNTLHHVLPAWLKEQTISLRAK
jgi:hypothetical protein